MLSFFYTFESFKVCVGQLFQLYVYTYANIGLTTLGVDIAKTMHSKIDSFYDIALETNCWPYSSGILVTFL